MRDPQPDFIIIGAMKCATSLLHNQLAAQPGFFMSDPKEPNFFSDDDIYNQGYPWYQSLFEQAKPTDIRGESSTHYTKLPTYPDTIKRMREHLDGTKLIYIMRHPIDRLVSHYIHEWTQRNISCPIDVAIERHPELIAYSKYAMQLEPYLKAFNPPAILPVFYERLIEHPQSELERVSTFLGHKEPVHWIAGMGAVNVSKDRLRKSPIRDTIMNIPGARSMKNLLPQSLKDRIKSRWRMEKRPKLSDSSRTHLEEIFNKDLTVLSSQLGIKLTTNNFRETVLNNNPIWSSNGETAAA